MDLELFHPEVQKFAKRLLGEVLENPYRCGNSGVVMGYWVESHTLGCRREAGDPDLWAAHWAIWEEYSKDGKSLLIGDPADGAFVSITPTKDVPGASMGAEMLIELGRRVKKTVPLATADQMVEIIENQLRPLTQALVVAGSVRRRKPEVGDIEFVALPKNLDEFLERMKFFNFTGGDRIQRGTLYLGKDRPLPVEVYIAHKPEEMGAMLFMYTGDWQHNIAMRSIAKRRGWKLDQYGIWDAKTGKKLLQSPDERDFYDFLGVSWHDPEDRGFATRKKKKKSSMGAVELVELGTSKRRVGYIYLELLTPEEDGTDHWVLQVERVDPYGGEPKRFEVLFNDEGEAKYWFNNTNGDEDLEVLAVRASQ